MPSSPARPCNAARCPNLQPCSTHGTSKPFGSVKRPTSSAKQGYGVAHRKWRGVVLSLHPVCPCGAVATDADHIIPASERPDLRYDVANGQGLCKRCHNSKTARDINRRGRQ